MRLMPGLADRQRMPLDFEAFARGGMVVPRQAWLDEPRRWLREEMASWKRDVDDIGIVVAE